MITVNEIAKIVGGTVQGDGDINISGMVSAAFAKEGDLTFAADQVGMEVAGKSRASCVITSLEATDYPKTLLKVGDIKLSLTILYNAMQKIKQPGAGTIHPTAVIDDSATLGSGVSVGPHTVIGKKTIIADRVAIGANCTIGDNVSIGQDSRLFSNITVYEYTVIGSNVAIHAGVVIGADGFGYVPKDGQIFKVPQLGNVIIEDDVEIGANACIDKGTFTSTVVGKGSKIDNLVQLGHNVKLGRNVLLAGQTGIGGSSTVGDNTMMGGQAGISDHIRIGKNAKIGAKSGVSGHVKDGSVLFGYPARDAREYYKHLAFVSWLYKNAGKIKGFLEGKK